MVLSHTVFRRPHSARVFGNIAAYKAVLVTCRIRSKHQTLLFNCLLQLKSRQPWLADRIKIIDIDLTDIVHPIGADHDPAVDRNSTAGVTNAPAARSYGKQIFVG